MKKITVISPGTVTNDTRVYVGDDEVPRDNLHHVGIEMQVGEVPRVILSYWGAEFEIQHGSEVSHIHGEGAIDAA
jgi:hypothetical protein